MLGSALSFMNRPEVEEELTFFVIHLSSFYFIFIHIYSYHGHLNIILCLGVYFPLNYSHHIGLKVEGYTKIIYFHLLIILLFLLI